MPPMKRRRRASRKRSTRGLASKRRRRFGVTGEARARVLLLLREKHQKARVFGPESTVGYTTAVGLPSRLNGTTSRSRPRGSVLPVAGANTIICSPASYNPGPSGDHLLFRLRSCRTARSPFALSWHCGTVAKGHRHGQQMIEDQTPDAGSLRHGALSGSGPYQELLFLVVNGP